MPFSKPNKLFLKKKVLYDCCTQLYVKKLSTAHYKFQPNVDGQAQKLRQRIKQTSFSEQSTIWPHVKLSSVIRKIK